MLAHGADGDAQLGGQLLRARLAALAQGHEQRPAGRCKLCEDWSQRRFHVCLNSSDCLYPPRTTKESLDGLRASPASLRLRRARAPHRRGDAAVSSRQASRHVREQSQRGARGHGVGRQAGRGAAEEPRQAPGRQAQRPEKQRGRPLQPHALVGVALARRRRRPERATWRRRSTARSARSTSSRPRSRPPAPAASAPAGRGSSRATAASRSPRRRTRTRRSPRARRRSSASTSGSTRTT